MINEEEIKWNAVENAIINFLKMNTKILDKRVQAKDTEGVKGGLKSIISGLVNAQRNLKLESVNEAGYTVKAENPYQFVNGAYAVLSAYLKDAELGPKGKRELQDIIKSLDYMRKYFYFKMSESVNEDVNFRDGKYRFYSKQGVGYLTYDGREISSGDFDWEDGSNSYWMYHSSWRGQKAFDTGKDVIAYFKSKKITTESVNEADLNWNAVQNAIINFLKVNTKILDKKVQAKDTEGVKGGLKSIISGLTNAQRSLKLESVKKSTFIKVARISNNGKLDIY